MQSNITRVLWVLIFFLALGACSSTNYSKRSDHSELYSPAMGRNMSYSVYTPPNWTPEESLPLVVLLHGARDNHETFDRYAVGQALDAEITNGTAPRVVVVSPDGELGFWENWHDGSRHYRDWVIKDLMPHIEQRYSTLPCPAYCHVSGISMGAHGAMRFAYYEPNTFSSVASISGPIISRKHPPEPSLGQIIFKWFMPIERIWGDIDGDTSHVPKDLDPYVSWVERDDLFELPLLIARGTEESSSIVNGVENFSEHLRANGKEFTSITYEGGHKWVYWREILGQVMSFHVQSNMPEPNEEISTGPKEEDSDVFSYTNSGD